MHTPLYIVAAARRAWRVPRVRQFVWVYLAALLVLALLQDGPRPGVL